MDKTFRVRHFKASVFAHATENQSKVRSSLLNIVPSSMRESLNVNEEVVMGHHGNEIRIYGVELHSDSAYEALKYLICSLSESDKNILLMSLDSRVGDSSSHLYIRLGKQEAYMGRITIRDGNDVIKVLVTVEGCRAVEDLKKFLTELIRTC
ncbi:MAG: RNA-binding domain-containing protein [Sulfolobales archaeon]|jgi:RNA binding exosome subunit